MTEATTAGNSSFENSVSETALLTLYLKAAETERPDCLIKDPVAGKILKELGADLSRFQGKKLSQVGTAIRCRRFDRETQRILREWDRPVIVHLGCGLDARFLRTDGGRGIQADLDLPDVMELRRRFFPENERNPQISASMLDTAWMDDILLRCPGHRFAFFIEGVLMYLREGEIRELIQNLADRFPGGEIYFDVTTRWCARHSNMHDSIREYGGRVRFNWGIDDPKIIEGWHPRLRLREQESYMDQEYRRWGWGLLLKFIPFLGGGGKMLRFDIEK